MVRLQVRDEELSALVELLRDHGYQLDPQADASPSTPVIPGATIAELERFAILETLKSTAGSTSRAADILGISVRTIQYRLHAYSAGSSFEPMTFAVRRRTE